MAKISTFWWRVATLGWTPWPISAVVTGFCEIDTNTPNYPALVFHKWGGSHHWLQSYCWETVRQSFTPKFSVHPVGKTMRWNEKWLAPFLMMSTSSITMQSLGKIWTTCTGCRCENVVFVCFFVYHSPGSARSSFEGYNLNRYCVTVYGSILMLFSPFFFSFSIHMQYIVFIFVTSWHHNFREIVLDNCKNAQNRWRSLCAPLCIDSRDISKKFHCCTLEPGT